MQGRRATMDACGEGQLHCNRETHCVGVDQAGRVPVVDVEMLSARIGHITNEATGRGTKAAHGVKTDGTELVLWAAGQETTVGTALGRLTITCGTTRSWRGEQMLLLSSSDGDIKHPGAAVAIWGAHHVRSERREELGNLRVCQQASLSHHTCNHLTD